MTLPQVARPHRIWAFLGSAVRERRVVLGISVEALSRLTGLTIQAVYNIEAARVTPGGSTIAKLCSVLDCTPNDLFLVREVDETVAPPDRATQAR